jgi:hypothetical protein
MHILKTPCLIFPAGRHSRLEKFPDCEATAARSLLAALDAPQQAQQPPNKQQQVPQDVGSPLQATSSMHSMFPIMEADKLMQGTSGFIPVALDPTTGQFVRLHNGSSVLTPAQAEGGRQHLHYQLPNGQQVLFMLSSGPGAGQQLGTLGGFPIMLQPMSPHQGVTQSVGAAASSAGTAQRPKQRRRSSSNSISGGSMMAANQRSAELAHGCSYE